MSTTESPARTSTTFTAFLRRNPSAGLLLVQLLGVVLYPLMESSPRGRALFGAFGLIVRGVALWVVRSGPWLMWVAVTLALPVVVLSLMTPMARALVMLESFAGIMYIALVVSRLINLAATGRGSDRTSS